MTIYVLYTENSLNREMQLRDDYSMFVSTTFPVYFHSFVTRQSVSLNHHRCHSYFAGPFLFRFRVAVSRELSDIRWLCAWT